MSALQSHILLTLTGTVELPSKRNSLMSREPCANQPSTRVSNIQALRDRGFHSAIKVYLHCFGMEAFLHWQIKSPASLTRCMKSLCDCSVFSLTSFLWRRVMWHLDQKIRDLETRNQASGNSRGHRTTYRNLGKSFNGYGSIDHNVQRGVCLISRVPF